MITLTFLAVNSTTSLNTSKFTVLKVLLGFNTLMKALRVLLKSSIVMRLLIKLSSSPMPKPVIYSLLSAIKQVLLLKLSVNSDSKWQDVATSLMKINCALFGLLIFLCLNTLKMKSVIRLCTIRLLVLALKMLIFCLQILIKFVLMPMILFLTALKSAAVHLEFISVICSRRYLRQ